MKKYLKLNKILGVLVIIWSLFCLILLNWIFGSLFNQIESILFVIFNLLTAFALFKKPIFGYILLGIGVVLTAIFIYVIFRVPLLLYPFIKTSGMPELI